MIKVDPVKCPQDHLCPAIGICPARAISQQGFKLPKIDPMKCIMCQKCIQFCPKKAFYVDNN